MTESRSGRGSWSREIGREFGVEMARSAVAASCCAEEGECEELDVDSSLAGEDVVVVEEEVALAEGTAQSMRQLERRRAEARSIAGDDGDGCRRHCR